jgi:predicted nucleotidyltransferase
MRLSENEIEAIKSSILKFDSNAIIYLFGSRADPKKKGGDIDLLIFSDTLDESDKLKIEMKLFEKIEEQKIDIVIAKDKAQPFVKIALKTGIRL